MRFGGSRRENSSVGQFPVCRGGALVLVLVLG